MTETCGVSLPFLDCRAHAAILLPMQKLRASSWLRRVRGRKRPYLASYYAMYSSLWDGIVTDPALMMVPADDHVVHRGDGVFETCKCENGRIYNFRAHLKRLAHSARLLGYRLPWSAAGITRRTVAAIRAGGHKDCLIRILVSRGPGSLDVNPCACDGPQLYITISALKRPFMESHPRGARAAASTIPVKEPFYAGIKNCNYLPNVLMKKEAVDRNLDFIAGFDGHGFLTEGATENFGIVSRRKELLFPKLKGILCGTTMMRVTRLAGRLSRSGDLRGVRFCDIPRKTMRKASEILVVGTTCDVVSVCKWEGKSVGNGSPGPVGRALDALLVEDIRSNVSLHTAAWRG